jgi:hypothetical protein
MPTPSQFLKIYFNIILSSTPVSHVVSFPQVSQSKSCMPISSPPYVLYAPSISFFFISLRVWWGVQIIKLLVMQSSPFPRYLVPITPTYLTRLPIVEHSQTMFFSQCEVPSFTPIQNNRQNYMCICKWYYEVENVHACAEYAKLRRTSGEGISWLKFHVTLVDSLRNITCYEMHENNVEQCHYSTRQAIAFVQPLLRWKSNKYYIFWKCVCNLRNPAFNAHAACCYLWPVRFYNIFPHFLMNGTILEKKVLNIKLVIWFSLKCLSGTFLMIRRTEQEMIKMYISLHVKYPLFFPDFNESWIFLTDFKKKYANTKFHENPFSGNRVVSCGQTDGPTDLT